MILALDTGNTNIVIGIVDENDKILFSARVATDHQKTEHEYAVFFRNIVLMHGIDRHEIDGAIISSVVPQLTEILKRAVRIFCDVEPLVVGPGVKTGLNILIDNPKQLGSDLVVDAVAALAEYKPPLIILDLGTASTMSVIDGNGNYRGGVIIPGVRISLDALASRASQLQNISLEAPGHVIGTNTIDCMKSGLIYGQASMFDGMIDRIEEELGQKATVVATGGLARPILTQSRRKIIIDDDLLIKGLIRIYRKNRTA
ncbi:MAG: type III pantothenate kinase [Clostridiales bacterium]|nr:type III pantothenate kinase [Clostridiales bacterium]